MKISNYGWIKDDDDSRDYKFVPKDIMLPNKVDLRSLCPPVYDQLSLGSCTANALASDVEFIIDKEKYPDFMPSRLFIYYNERKIEHTTKSDSGAQIRDGIKSLAKWGVCHETSWAYDISKFTMKPPKAIYKEALKDVINKYERIKGLESFKNALAQGYPVVFGFEVFEDFESTYTANTGIVRMPSGSQIGGHAVKGVGFDDNMTANGVTGYAIVKNSWGKDWGEKGYFYIPYSYLDSELCSDFWVIYTVK